MTKEMNDLFAMVPADKRKEVFDCLVKANDAKDMLAKIKKIGVVLDENKIKGLFEKLKNASDLNEEEIDNISSGK